MRSIRCATNKRRLAQVKDGIVTTKNVFAADGARRVLSRLSVAALAGGALLGAAGCSQNRTILQNYWKETNPTVDADYDTPTASVIYATKTPAPQRVRDWQKSYVASDDAPANHWPLYFEDPFEDKGTGREGRNKYYVGWEDYVAMAYTPARYHLNYLLLPISAIVTPPWTIMESDGELSKQLLGYDHDAIPEGQETHGQPGLPTTQPSAAQKEMQHDAMPGATTTPSSN